MTARPALKIMFTIGLAALCQGGAAANDAPHMQRYRGDYTRGHEVNSFCPAKNSRCYWVAPATDPEILGELEQLANDRTTRPYESVCLVIDALIDTESARVGFAADYDGLIEVARVYGTCDDTTVFTHGDLQHHRWVLESIDGKTITPSGPDYRVPELDFGERMHVAGNTGCNGFTGTAVLQDTFFRIDSMVTTNRVCTPEEVRLELTMRTVLAAQPELVAADNHSLLMRAEGVELRFVQRDWAP